MTFFLASFVRTPEGDKDGDLGWTPDGEEEVEGRRALFPALPPRCGITVTAP